MFKEKVYNDLKKKMETLKGNLSGYEMKLNTIPILENKIK